MRNSLSLLVTMLAVASQAGTVVTLSSTVQVVGPGGRILVYGTVDNTAGKNNAATLLIYPSVISGTLQDASLPAIDSFYPGTYLSKYGYGSGLLPVGQSYTGLLLAFEPLSSTLTETGILSLRTVLYTSRFEGGVIFQQDDAGRVQVVPEPASLAAVGLGLMGVLARRRRSSAR